MAVNVPSDLDLVSRFVYFRSEDGHFTVDPPMTFTDKTPSLGTFLSKERGSEVIKRLKLIFQTRRYITKDPLLFAIAHIIRNMPVTESHDEDKIRNEAYSLAQDVCESALDLFTFVHFNKETSPPKKAGFGHGMRTFIANWYFSKPPLKLAHEVTRFKSGRGWTHRDLIRQCHMKTDKKSKASSVVLNYLTQKKYQLTDDLDCEDSEVGEVVQFLKDIKSLSSPQPVDGDFARSLIEKHKLVDQQIPTFLRNLPQTFEGRLGNMTMEEIFNSIPKMATLGMLEQCSIHTPLIIETIKNLDLVKRSKIHPVVIFLVMRRYESDRSKKYVKNYHLIRALQAAFTASLESLPSIGTKTLVAVHVEGKAAKQHVLGANYLSPILPCALMTNFLLQSEDNLQLVYFNQMVSEINLSRTVPMARIVEAFVSFTRDPANTSYDLVEPIKWATQHKKPFDNILILCDKKMVSSQADLHNAIDTYRREVLLPNAKFLVVGLTDLTSVTNKMDLNMCEVSGFNKKIPSLIYNFFLGHYDVNTEDMASKQP
ncbi:60 kDa SS-A/Ro ribonucleoprotein [Biomphalaria pfeifferi]|uniref:60 kDa SS-A/Ro ribonucleoprotein n=1 Tax=Biomphalaria pfeifferi TaxID=112525 RepID=A0AAD8C589_BIOPF|nr:60 kDa SS-A/Ro ribonucleoprotein [Biomphalaria pfeifferi]